MYAKLSRERDRRKLPTLQPMNGRSVDCDSFLCTDVRTVLEVAVLAFLLGLEIQACQTSEVLLYDGLIDGGAATNALTVIVRYANKIVLAALSAKET
jgi:hypothetical protein